ncbi:MAG TPA: Ig-like domain-containing protein [Dongiaceae bacterium]|nr:Ig-like domain-containing protein [Dongiaceae bacterium]
MNRSIDCRGAGSRLAGLALLAALTGCGGGGSGHPYQPPTLSDGVVFTYPLSGQTDVPTGTRFYVGFSRTVSASAVSASCSVDGGGNVSGNFCLVGPGNSLVTISPNVNGKVVEFETDQLRQGTPYALHVRGAVIGGGSTNLPTSGPLLTFTTSQNDPLSGSVPSVRAINGEQPNIYLPGGTQAGRYPFMDFATLRVEFSEPLDEKTVQVGSSFQFLAVNGSTETPVAGSLMVRRQHVSFDPDEDLTPGTTYRLRLTNAVRDLNGEALANVSYELVPLQANACNCVITQQFHTTVAFGESGFPATSFTVGKPVNGIDLYSPLIGSNAINLMSSTVQAELADPGNFNGLIPFVIRRGNFLTISGLDLQLGGAVPANLQTGDIKATFLSDVTGFLGRNPFRGADTVPDDAKSPVFVYLSFDLALTATDSAGNAVLNQTIPHVQATGTARVIDGNLTIETVRTLTMDLLGLDLAPAHMVLGIRSDLNASKPEDTTAPTISGSYPADGAVDFPIRDGLSLVFSEAIDNAGLVAGNQIQLFDITSSVSVPFQLTFDGATVLLKPDNALTFGHQYRITLGALTDISDNHNSLVLDGADASGGDGMIQFTTENPNASGAIGPMVSSINSGAPCALTGSSYASPGHCSGGSSGDTNYVPFDMPANGYLDVQFNQAMNTSTLVAGTTCNSGRVRVEIVDGSGNCTGVVAGSLIADTRAFHFKPTQPWVAGTDYRLTLVGGTNATCDSATEICGNNNLPLNPDPLNGAEAADAGGSNLVVRFRGVAANDDVYLPLKLEPYTDINGNGFVNSGEVARSQNRADVTVLGFGGILSNVVLVGDPTIYLNGSLPVSVGQPEPLTIDGNTWGMNIAGNSQIPVRINPGVLYGTSIGLNASAIGISIGLVNTGINVLRLRETGGPITGYIVQEDGVAEPQFVAQLNLYMDAPDMAILGGVVSHNLHSSPLSVVIKGPVSFLDDGRILIEPASVGAINLTVNISAVGIIPGNINLRIPSGGMQLRLIGNPLKGRR